MDYPGRFSADFHKESRFQLIKHQTIEKGGKLWEKECKSKTEQIYRPVLLIITHAKVLNKFNSSIVSRE